MTIVSIQDAGGTAFARIQADLGFNCFEFRATVGDRLIDVLWSEPGIEQGTARPSGSGIPLLFPFPGRIVGTTFEWDGQSFLLNEGDGRGNAIHGFVHTRPWRVTAQTGDSVSAEFQASIDDAQLLDCWPADFLIEATYRIEPKRLISHLRYGNPDEKPLPCGLGTHPYFRLPLGGPSADDCRIVLPVSTQWELKELLPTGSCTALEDTALRSGAKFAELTLDNVFGGLQEEDGKYRSSILDPASGIRLSMSCGKPFRELVVYTPPHREAICIEPQTMLPASFELARQGQDTGVRVLEPGEFVEAEIVYELCPTEACG